MPEGYGLDWAVVLIVGGVGLAGVLAMFLVSYLVAPKRPSEIKNTPYECGMPTSPHRWSQIQIRYYVFAILFLIFDVEAVFLFPLGGGLSGERARRLLRDDGVYRHPVFRCGLRVEEGSAPVEIKPLGFSYEPGRGNQPAESVLERVLPNALVAKSNDLFALARKNSLWTLSFGLACCAIEMMSTHMSHHDFDRFGVVTWPSPRQADVMIVAGTVVKKMADPIKLLYEQMPDPKWVIAMGSCATNGGPYYRSYSVVMGVDHLVPVDVYIPGCPPRPEALLYGLMQLQEKIQKDATERDSATSA